MEIRRLGASGLKVLQICLGAMTLDRRTAGAKRAAACATLMLAFGTSGHAAEEPSATPYRPTVSNPADLPLPGWLEFEAGGLRTRGGELARRDSFPYLFDRWTFGAEVSGTTRHGVSDTAQFLVAASYGYSKRVVFDAGAAFGLNRASPDWALFAGVTVLLGRLW